MNSIARLAARAALVAPLCPGALLAASAPSPAAPAQPAACKAIATAQDLDLVRNDLAGTYCLTADIDAGSITNFMPIGDYSHPFTGSFDGQGHAIKRLTIKNPGLTLVALFGSVSGTIRNLALASVNIAVTTDSSSVGALVGELEAGGVVSNCSSAGKVANAGQYQQIGGLVALSNQGAKVVGSHSSARVVGGYGARAGGLVGLNAYSASISNSYATGDVSGTGQFALVGGLVGDGGGFISRSFATGSVSADINGYAGGLVGFAEGTESDVYATGPVTTGGGTPSFAGGLIGVMGDSASLTRSYSTGPASGGAATGGLIGDHGQATLSHLYWDIETSGLRHSSGGKGLTTVALTANLPKGFSAKTWAIRAGTSYPYLIGVTPGKLIPKPN